MTVYSQMEKRFRYNFEILYEATKRDNAILLQNYDKITKRSIINFRCHCGEESEKNCFQLITKSGAFCKKCIKQRQIIKLHATVNAICNIESLSDKIKSDIIFYDKITKYIIL